MRQPGSSTGDPGSRFSGAELDMGHEHTIASILEAQYTLLREHDLQDKFHGETASPVGRPAFPRHGSASRVRGPAPEV